MKTEYKYEINKNNNENKEKLIKQLIGGLVTTFSLVSFINLGYMLVTNIEIHNSWTTPIKYAVDAPAEETVKELSGVKEWMERNNLTQGNTCVFIQSNPSCKLDVFYSKLIGESIKEAELIVNSTNLTDISNVSLKLNERFIERGQRADVVKTPINFNLYLRYGNLYSLGWFVDFFSWFWMGVLIFLVALVIQN